MTSMIVNIPDDMLKEIRKEAFINNVSVARLIELLIGLGLDVFTGRAVIQPQPDPEEE